MSDPVIHVIPEHYYGGAAPLPVVHKESPNTPSVTPAPSSRKLPTKKVFIVGVAILFVLVVGGASWYFTRGLRARPAPVAPVVEIPPAVTPPSTPEPPPQETPVVVPPAPVSEAAPDMTKDTDNDGLTDAEEQMYHTDLTKPDTDNDGFLDGHEVVNLYNPSGTAPEKLEAAGLVKRIVNEMYQYEFLIPTSWNATPSNEGQSALLIANAEGKRMLEISIVPYVPQKSLREWYSATIVSPPAEEWTSNKAGLLGLIKADKSAGYLTKDATSLYVVTIPQGTNPLEMTATFSMVLNSLKLR